jgi:hypothetical protein
LPYGLSKKLRFKSKITNNMNFIERKISVNKAISLLAKNNAEVNEKEADIILDFLYLIAKNNLREAQPENPLNLNRKSNKLKSN